jgi:hypothetical protein
VSSNVGVHVLTGEEGAALGERAAPLASEHEQAFRGADQSGRTHAPGILRRLTIDSSIDPEQAGGVKPPAGGGKLPLP